MARAAANLVDGMGPTRIMLAAVGTIPSKDGSPVRLRPATLADEAWLLEMQSYPDTRRYFQNPDIPTPDEHHLWMQRTLNNPARLLALVECKGVVAGMIRLDQLSGEHSLPHYEVSIAIVPGRKRGGIGTAALSLARRLVPSAILDATIMPQNSASILLFTRSGFVFHSNHIYRSSPQ
jgi:RimJ/RimL family protein N-acetyltransferase